MILSNIEMRLEKLNYNSRPSHRINVPIQMMECKMDYKKCRFRFAANIHYLKQTLKWSKH